MSCYILIVKLLLISLSEPTSIWLLDSNQLGWGYRAFRAKWMEEFGAEIACEFEKLALRDIYDTKVQRKHAGGPRGDHDPIIIGHYRQSAKVYFFLQTLFFISSD